jgi:DNA-binding NtrC family response regulator
VTAYGKIRSAINAMKLGAFEYIEKPFSAEQLQETLNNALKFRLATRAHKKMVDDSLHNILGNSHLMELIVERIKRISHSDASVLIYGESGTGKELIARALHQTSQRNDRAFIPVDCVALPEHLLESELFGHERGAFTGAETMRRGLLEYADKGTLFLDEICELAPTLQAKLLRVLQQREFRRVGGKDLIQVDLRIISATNKRPADAIRNRELREDLYYRLNVIPIEIPPLRERTEDIPLLVERFIERFSRANNCNGKTVHSLALEALMSYSWPGNVRELQNVVERVMSLTADPTICVADLPDYIASFAKVDGIRMDEISRLPFLNARQRIHEEFEKQYIIQLLQRCKGNISKAAQTAKVSRRTIYRLLHDYDLQDHIKIVES